MKNFTFLVFAMLWMPLWSQGDHPWSDHLVQHPGVIFSIDQRAAMITGTSGRLVGWQVVNFYSQRECNSIGFCGYQFQKKRKWGMELARWGNRNFSAFRAHGVWAQQLSKEMVIGAKIGVGSDHFPQNRLYCWEWECSMSFRHQSHYALCWIQRSGSQDGWNLPPGAGIIWSYSISNELHLQLGVTSRVHQSPQYHIAIGQQSHHNWDWYVGLEPKNLGVLVGGTKRMKHWKVMLGIYHNTLFLPSCQYGGVYVR